MEVIDFIPSVSQDGSTIFFRLSDGHIDVECAIGRAALEAQFWLPLGADDTRTLRTFADGWRRIRAVAERKRLVRPGQRLWLTALLNKEKVEQSVPGSAPF
jgi:hypothetical protein